MVKESSITLRVCDFITKYSIYALIFLVPIFFLPWTSEILDFNKQILLVLLVFISLFAVMLKILVSGRFEVKKSWMNLVIGVSLVIFSLSTVFSVFRYGSFWGQPQQMSESLVAVLAFSLFYFLVSNIFSKKEIFTSVTILFISALIAEIIGILQLFKIYLPFSFAKSVFFNTVGSVGALGFFAAILLPLSIAMLIASKKWWKGLFIAEIVLSTLLLILINYSIIWWAVIIGSALMLILGVLRSDLFDGRWMSLPTFFLAVSLFFVLLNPPMPWPSQKISETVLSQNTSLSISIGALKEHPIFGSGIGTFAYDFSKFKNPDFNKTSLWNIPFNKAYSKVLNTLATTGIIGLLAILALIVFPIYYGIRFFVFKKKIGEIQASEKSDVQVNSILVLGLSVSIIIQGISYFLYNSNIVLDLVFFFLIAALIGIIVDKKKEYLLKPSSIITLVTTLIFTLVFIFGMGLLILDGDKYAAEVKYMQGVSDYQAGKNIEGLENIKSAARLNNSSDLYFRQLSQAYLLSLQDELKKIQANQKMPITDQQKSVINVLVSNSNNAALIATTINPNDANNWSFRGYIYQNLNGFLDGALDWAIKSYDTAIKLDPNNPYLYNQEGNVYLAFASKLTSDQADLKNKYYSQAQAKLEKAVLLNPNYSDALYSLGITYDYLGQRSKEIDVFTKLQILNPKNTDIKIVLNNLQAGRSALQMAAPVAANPPSGTESIKPAKTTTKTK